MDPGQREDADRDPRQRHERAVAAERTEEQHDEHAGGEDRLDRREVNRGGERGQGDHLVTAFAGTTCCIGGAAWWSRARMPATGARSGLRKLVG